MIIEAWNEGQSSAGGKTAGYHARNAGKRVRSSTLSRTFRQIKGPHLRPLRNASVVTLSINKPAWTIVGLALSRADL